MKKPTKGLQFLAVLWVIMLIVAVAMLSIGIYSLVSVEKVSEKTDYKLCHTRPSQTSIDISPNTIRVTNKREPEPKPKYVWEPLYGKDLYIFYIEQINEQYYPDVDPIIAQAVMEVESNYNPDVQSSVGAVGLMQVLPWYHAYRMDQHGLNDIWDPYTNIIVGMDFLNDLIHTYGTWERALLGYNNSSVYVQHVLDVADDIREERGLS